MDKSKEEALSDQQDQTQSGYLVPTAGNTAANKVGSILGVNPIGGSGRYYISGVGDLEASLEEARQRITKLEAAYLELLALTSAGDMMALKLKIQELELKLSAVNAREAE